MSKFLIKPSVPVLNFASSLTSGLIFITPLFEDSGIITKNIFNKITGSFVNTPLWNKSLVGTGINFVAASNQYIDFGTPTSLKLARNFTIVALIKKTSDDVSNARSIFAYANGGFLLRTTTAGKLNFLKSQTANILTGNKTIANNVLTSVALTIDNNSTANIVMYVDGLQDATGTTTQDFSSPALNLSIGRDQNSADSTTQNPFDGDIIQVLFYNRALNAQEIKQLYINPWIIYQKLSLGYQNGRYPLSFQL